MTTDELLHTGTLMSIGVSLVILVRFLVSVGRAFAKGLAIGYRRERPSPDVPEEPGSDTDALLDRVETAVQALRTSTILLTVTTDSLAAALAAAVDPPATNHPADAGPPATGVSPMPPAPEPRES